MTGVEDRNGEQAQSPWLSTKEGRQHSSERRECPNTRPMRSLVLRNSRVLLPRRVTNLQTGAHGRLSGAAGLCGEQLASGLLPAMATLLFWVGQN